MKNLKTKILTALIIIISVFSSCREEDLTDVVIEPKFKNKWLSFRSKDELKNFVDRGKEKELTEFKSTLQSYQNDGFKSLIPNLDEYDELQIEAFAQNRISEMQQFMSSYGINTTNLREDGESLEIDIEDDPIIADPYFASILNEDREILVANDVYRFTEKGMFYTSLDNYNNLYRAIERIEPCVLMQTQGLIDVGMV